MNQYWTKYCEIEVFDKEDKTYVVLKGECIDTKNIYEVHLRAEDYLKLKKGINLYKENIIGKEDMEFLISGISPNGWDKTYKKSKTSKESINVYITIANSKKIIWNIDPYNPDINASIYKKSIYFFNKYEKNKLQLFQEFFKNPELFIKDYYNEIQNRDTLKYVYEDGHAAYHKSLDCSRLKSNFTNYLIPEEIKEKGQDKIFEFREWCKENIYLIEKNKSDIFLERCRLKFGLSATPEFVDFENSGSFEFLNLTKEEIEDQIDEKLIDAAKFYNLNNKTSTVLKRYQKYSYSVLKNRTIEKNDTGYSDSEVIQILEQFNEDFKTPVYNLLIEWYRIKFNPNLKFENRLLDELGFKPCSECFPNNYLQSLD